MTLLPVILGALGCISHNVGRYVLVNGRGGLHEGVGAEFHAKKLLEIDPRLTRKRAPARAQPRHHGVGVAAGVVVVAGVVTGWAGVAGATASAGVSVFFCLPSRIYGRVSA